MSTYSNLSEFNKKLLQKNRFKIYISSESDPYEAHVVGEVTISMTREGAPSTIEFEVVYEKDIEIDYGNSIQMYVDGEPFWYGYIFELSGDKEPIVKVKGYDQLRYFKNKDTYQYEDTKYSELLKRIIEDRNLLAGEIEDTKYPIAGRIEENKEFLEMLQVASDFTTAYTGNIFILYDRAGKICLTEMNNMKVNDLLFDMDIMGNFEYTGSIDTNTYNRIKVDLVDETTNTVTPVVVEDKNNIAKWGILQWYAQTTEKDTVAAKARQLLEILNRPTRSLQLKDIVGSTSVRAGSLIPVKLKLRDIEVDSYMLVESIEHHFKDNWHWMDAEVYNKDFMPEVNTENVFEFNKKNNQENSEDIYVSTGSGFNGMQGTTNKQKIWSYFASKGFTKEAIAGIMANLMHESRLNPETVQGGGRGPGHGLLQWEGGRLTQLKQYAKSKGKSWTDMETQLDFALMEMMGTGGVDKYSSTLWDKYGGFEKFKSIKDVNEATRIFEAVMERAGRPMMDRRYSYGQQIYNEMKDWNPNPTAPKAGGGSAGVSNIARNQGMLNYGKTRIGNRYLYGAANASGSIDCSGFVWRSMQSQGYKGPRFSTGEFGSLVSKGVLQKIPMSQKQPGDIMWMSGHTGFYYGDGKSLEATPPKVGVYSFNNNRWTAAYRWTGKEKP